MSPSKISKPYQSHPVQSPRAQPEAHLPDDKSVKAGFDSEKEIDRGRESSNGGYLPETFSDDKLNPPLAPGAKRYVGPHEPLNFNEKMNSTEGVPNASERK